METLIIIALIVGGLILFAIEVFLIPGISIAGIGSAVCILYAIYSAFTSLARALSELIAEGKVTMSGKQVILHSAD
jgi:membrane-bound ClpP family serine protease